MDSSHAPKGEDHELLLFNDSQDATRDKSRPEQSRRRHKWLSGARFTLALASGASIIVLLFNLSFLLWAVARDRLKENRGGLYEGGCDRVRHLGTGLHLLINILSTTLLGASNYGMQCLSAPTRKDVDKAHGRGTWLDIGIQSIRNLFHVSGKRLIMWICLVLSSFPLHLVYNSAIFSTTAAYPYTIFAGPSSPKIPAPGDTEIGRANEADIDAFYRLHSSAQNGTLLELDAHECIKNYATTYQTKYGALILVTDDVDPDFEYEVVGSQDVYNTRARVDLHPPAGDPYAWLCPPDPDAACSTYISGLYSKAEQNDWVVYGVDRNYTVKSCLSAPLPEHCKLQYSFPLTITVIVANIIKASVLCYMAVTTEESPLLTTGDAVASFLQQPDKRTMGKCLMPGSRIRGLNYAYIVCNRPHWPYIYNDRPKRWYTTISRAQRVAVVILWAVAFCICASLLGMGLSSDGKGVWNAEFGAINAQALIRGDNWPTSAMSNTIIANIPQVVFSTLYFVVNGVVTKMALAGEWSQYAVSRKGIRVSWDPQHAQRSTYFLSLPYRYAMPLLAACAILHWLISQSLFVVEIEAYDMDFARNPNRDIVTCGYTPVAIVSAMSVWTFMFVCVVGLGMLKFASGMCVAESCSLAIAAACHPNYDPNLGEYDQSLETPEGIEFLPLQWGSAPVRGPMGHCTFSADEVEVPEDGRKYE
ncbi:hypothetical protein BJY01DRAFT_255181 [Aspergillus pseudoustus]|uniref:DUF6536 domain-containing protein n=1 Tax=Aspergillus pseudoustus TaxID=1810923 RepID=A0ABR4IMP3_9EURO